MAFDKVVDSGKLDEVLTDIADQIRLKTDSASPIALEDMPLAISMIESGGGLTVDDLTVSTGIGTTLVVNVQKVLRQYAFSGFSITSANLPICKALSAYAFLNCTALTTVYAPALEQMENNAFRNCSKLTEIVLPAYNNRIDMSTFEGCSSLRKADFGRLYYGTGIAINNYALACTNLEALIIRDRTVVPNIASMAFGAASTKMNKGEGFIYVPRSIVDAYKANAGWSKYSAQIRAIEDHPEITGV